MFGTSIKVHFAGCERNFVFESALDAGVKYGLFSVFPFISHHFEIPAYQMHKYKGELGKQTIDILKSQIGDTRHMIMDSGLFTLMFGSQKGRRDEKFMTIWMEKLCEFVISQNIKATCVETDCQKILGVDAAWRLRKRMKGILKNNRIINVFHLEDGARGLDRLIEYSEYIAISVPELRIRFGLGKEYQNATIRFANYIKNKKPDIDIHLLGCTTMDLLKSCKFCTSSDSTSWMGFVRYGSNKFGSESKQRNISSIRAERMNEMLPEMQRRFANRGINESESVAKYAVAYSISAKDHLNRYEKNIGSQR